MIPKISGNRIINSFAWLNEPYKLLDRALDQHGLTLLIDLPGMGESLLTGDPAYIEEIIRNKQLIGGRGTQALRPLFGNDSLIILEGDAHHSRRKFLLPFFKAPYINKFDNLTLEITAQEIRHLKSSFSVSAVIRQISLKVIIQLIFGKLSKQKETQLIQLVNNYYFSFKNPLYLFARALHFNLGRFSPWGRLTKNRNALYEFITQEINQRRAQPEQNSDCLLSEFIKLSDTTEKIPTNESIFNEVLSLLLFGHDTGAVTMGWLFHHIYQQPDIVQKLKSEVTDNAQTIVNIDNNKFTFLKSCLLESMRLAPAVVHLTRVAQEDTQLRGHIVKKHTRILPSTYLAQHNPEVFHQPYAFKPERFTHKNDYAYSFFPFGFGERKCVGEQLALRQMQLIFSIFIRDSNISLDKDFTVTAQRQMLLIGPSHGTMMRNNKQVIL